MVLVPLPYAYLLEGRGGIPWHEMNPEMQRQRFEDFCRINWGQADFISRLILQGVSNTKVRSSQVEIIEPETIPSLARFSELERAQYREIGDSIIRGGGLCKVVLAAGDAARFRSPGDDRPKALIEISDRAPFSQETYLSVHARDTLLTERQHQTKVPLLIFVNPLYLRMFETYLAENRYFGLDPDNIIFVEHTGDVPRFTKRGRIAMVGDMAGQDPDNQQVAFGKSGHGYFATAFRENPVIISGRRLEGITPFDELRTRQVTHLAQFNIDNLGGRVSTEEYKIILGWYWSQEQAGMQMVVELTTPLIGMRSDGTKYFWDDGGVALKVNGKPTIVDGNALEGDILKRTRNPEKPFPFNTANATYGVESIHTGISLPPTLQERNGVLLFETSIWNMARELNTGMLLVPRKIPESLAALPPTKTETAGRLVSPYQGQGTVENRFIPTKEKQHREHAVELYSASSTPELRILQAEKMKHSPILIVEDNEQYAETISKILKDKGFGNVTIVFEEEDAKRMLAQKKYAFILLDSILKTGEEKEGETGGIRILKMLRKEAGPDHPNRTTPVLFWTSQTSEAAFQGMSRVESLSISDVIGGRKEEYDGDKLEKLILRHLI
jgi:CheY-like chemotaxis protein